MIHWKIAYLNEYAVEFKCEKYSLEYYLSVGNALSHLVGVTRFHALPHSLVVIYNPHLISVNEILLKISNLDFSYKKNSKVPKTHYIPVCFHEKFAVDSSTISLETSLSFDKVIELFCEVEYEVYMYGFVAGFFYLKGLPEKLQLQRKKVPASNVSKGSVAFAHAYAGIYPIDTPGGWHVIGRTPLMFFDPITPPFFQIEPGDCVKFYQISLTEYHEKY